MTVLAQLVYTQNSVVGSPSQAFVGTIAGGAVAVSNFSDTGIETYNFYLLDVPVGSDLASDVSLTVPVQSGSTTTYTFTPDVAGSYRVMLIVIDAFGNQSADQRDFVAKTLNRHWLLPGFLSNNLTLNYPDPTNPNTTGWKDALSKIFADLDASALFNLNGTGTNDITEQGTQLLIGATEIIFGETNEFGFAQESEWITPYSPIPTTTDGTTWVTLGTLTPRLADEWGDEKIVILAADVTGIGAIYRSDLLFSYSFVGAVFSLYPTTPAVSNQRGDAEISDIAVRVVVNGGGTALLIQVRGVADVSIQYVAKGKHLRL